jgi:hypothetical protein
MFLYEPPKDGSTGRLTASPVSSLLGVSPTAT